MLPAVNMPTPGGLTYEDMIRILRGVAAKADIVGLAMVEYVPARDDRHLMSGLVAARIAAVTMGLVVERRFARTHYRAPTDWELTSERPPRAI